jgi:hypothetical protein
VDIFVDDLRSRVKIQQSKSPARRSEHGEARLRCGSRDEHHDMAARGEEEDSMAIEQKDQLVLISWRHKRMRRWCGFGKGATSPKKRRRSPGSVSGKLSS